ncbi:MAG: RNA-binding protein [Elusimicrobiota bacterium]|nr:MAG: RNA-binding protein [Elusimicrobiota bacterium]
MGKKLFVGGLPYETNDVQLKELFAASGAVLSAKVIIDRETGKSKGFGFVEMGTDDEAKAAILKYNNFSLGTRRIMVNEARPMEPRPAGGYPPRPSSPGGFGGPRPGGFGGPRPGGPGGGDRNPNFGADSKPFDERKNRYEEKKKKRGPDEFDKKGGGPKKGGGGKHRFETDDDDGW